MEGRWQIRVCAGCGEHLGSTEVHSNGFHGDGSPAATVGAVPCDDAAVERGAKALFKAMEDVAHLIPDVAVLAAVVLRAAGESS